MIFYLLLVNLIDTGDMSSKSKMAKTSAKGGVKKEKSGTPPSGGVRNTERDGENRSSTVESVKIAPETVNSESGIAAILVMMERNRQEERKREGSSSCNLELRLHHYDVKVVAIGA